MKSEKTILVVDDEPANVLLLKKILEKQNYRIITAYSGTESLVKMREIVPDIVLLDLMMPGINGFEVLSRMKGDPLTNSIPVVILSALTDPDTEERAITAGAVSYITKPIRITKILDTILAVIYPKFEQI